MEDDYRNIMNSFYDFVDEYVARVSANTVVSSDSSTLVGANPNVAIFDSDTKYTVAKDTEIYVISEDAMTVALIPNLKMEKSKTSKHNAFALTDQVWGPDNQDPANVGNSSVTHWFAKKLLGCESPDRYAIGMVSISLADAFYKDTGENCAHYSAFVKDGWIMFVNNENLLVY